MEHEFTAGTHRALNMAATWSRGDGSAELDGPSLLLGLLSETECHAALILAERGIDSPAIRRRWPGLEQVAPAPPVDELHADGRTPEELGHPLPHFSPDTELSFTAAADRLFEYPKPLIFTSEHLLLGLVAAETEVGQWLRGHGLEPDELEALVRRHDGITTGPLSLPDDLLTDQTPQSEALAVDALEFADDTPADARSEPPSISPAPDPIAQPESGNSGDNTSSEQPSRPIRVLRVLDAAANRGREGLRAIEDYTRFVLDDLHLTERLKRLRHDMTQALSRIGLTERLVARETRADVGTQLSTPSERARGDTTDVLAANFARLQEALRSLEEFGKIVDPNLAEEIKQLRYRTYTLHRAVEITRSSLKRIGKARLYVLVDGRASTDEFDALIHSLVASGVDMIQLRDKRLDDRQLLDRARRLRKATLSSETLFVMNDRPDLAVLSRADGVHVGQEELPVKDVRTVVGSKMLIGVSTHSIDQARCAVLDGADYIGVGPTFPSGTKQFEHYPGLELLRTVTSEIRLPAFAIGGLDGENLSDVLSTGIRRVAIGGAIQDSPDPAQAVAEIQATLAKFEPELDLAEE